MHTYTALNANCAHRYWTGTEWFRCMDNVWTHVRNGQLRRIQTPYCERHAREFGDARDSSAEYQYR